MDVDIDFKDRSQLIDLVKPVIASRIDAQGVHRHNVGVYFQDIPLDPTTGQASLDYKVAEDLGYTKIDFLNLNIYQGVESVEHMDQLVQQEPIWELLEERSIVEKLFQLGSDLNTDVCLGMKPRTLEELAIVIAIVRPGKQHLIGKSWEAIRREIWEPSEKYWYKKSHAFGYAMVIAVQLNLLVETAQAQSIDSDS